MSTASRVPPTLSMKPALLAIAAALVGCYRPSPPEGAPCSASGACPSSLACDRGLCVRTPVDADVVDQGLDDALDALTRDAAIDAPIDAAQPITTFGAGAHTFEVPMGCPQLRVKLWGGGGGGGGDGTGAENGTDGGSSILGALRAGGGKGGDQGNPGSIFLGGAGGTAVGGAITITGSPGGNGQSANVVAPSGAGGASPNGGSGGPSVTTIATDGNAGMPPGGGGSGGQGQFSPAAGGGGGGYVEGTLAVTAGQALAFTVGAGGPGGVGNSAGGGGADGRVTMQCQ